MNAVCESCGLPKELCVCETIAKEKQKITVKIVKQRYGKIYTTINGIDNKSIDLKMLAKKLKSKFACGGTIKNNQIELQGDHRSKIKDFLAKQGFAEETIEVQ
ncbi:MAG: stress response translation initiation inhibitor YciH [Candidatus Nanoarchaeia archaeon]|nr:stress response translation initiation inhibitor YciH [Candidatus Nanoarchaeia archaeon]